MSRLVFVRVGVLAIARRTLPSLALTALPLRAQLLQPLQAIAQLLILTALALLHLATLTQLHLPSLTLLHLPALLLHLPATILQTLPLLSAGLRASLHHHRAPQHALTHLLAEFTTLPLPALGATLQTRPITTSAATNPRALSTCARSIPALNPIPFRLVPLASAARLLGRLLNSRSRSQIDRARRDCCRAPKQSDQCHGSNHESRNPCFVRTVPHQ